MFSTIRTTLAAAALALAGSAASAATTFTVTFDSAQEVAPAGVTASPGTGFGNLVLNQDLSGSVSLSYNLFFDGTHDFGPILGGAFGNVEGKIQDVSVATGTEVTRLHIHNGDRGVNGPVAYGIINPDQDANNNVFVNQENGGFRVTGSWDEGDGAQPLSDFLTVLLNAQTGDDVPLYFNLHTASDPAGALRGQVIAANDVAAIPLPPAIALSLLGFAGLALIGRRRA